MDSALLNGIPHPLGPPNALLSPYSIPGRASHLDVLHMGILGRLRGGDESISAAGES